MTRSIVAIVGGLTCLMIFRVGRMLSVLVEADPSAELDRVCHTPVEPPPEAGVGAQAQTIREISIRVIEAGSITLDGRAVDDASLETELMKLAGKEPEPVIVIHADEQAPYQRVIDVLNLVAKARLKNVTFEVPSQE